MSLIAGEMIQHGVKFSRKLNYSRWLHNEIKLAPKINTSLLTRLKMHNMEYHKQTPEVFDKERDTI